MADKLIVNFTRSDIETMHSHDSNLFDEPIKIFGWHLKTESGKQIDVDITIGKDPD